MTMWFSILQFEARIIDLLVLVNAHYVEPVRFLGPRLEELDFTISESSKQPLISDIAHPIKRELSLPFL